MSAAQSVETAGRSGDVIATGGRRSFGADGAAAAPPVDADEQEQPDDVDEVPVPRRRLEAEMVIGLEMPGERAEEIHGEEAGADDDMEAVEAGRHEERRGIDPAFEAEGGVAVLPGLEAGEADAEDDGQSEAADQPFAVVLEQRVMRPGDRGAGSQQDQR